MATEVGTKQRQKPILNPGWQPVVEGLESRTHERLDSMADVYAATRRRAMTGQE